MKKVFQIKLKNITRVFALVVAASLVTFTGCKSYDEDITGLQGQIDKVVTDVAGLKTSVAALQTSVSGMTYIKSITMGTDGKLTITPSTGAAIVYDAKTYVTYDIALTNNVLTVNGVNKGTVAIPALTFADGVLKSGTSTVADLTSWLKSGLTVVDGMLAINGQKTSVAISVPAGKSVKDVTLVGNNVTVSYTDGSASTTFVNDAPIVATTGANGNLFVNGVDTGVMVKNTFAVSADGFLTVNGVKTTVAIPAENKSTVIINKDGSGAVVSATIGDGKDSFTVKVNPTNELLSSILFVPEWIDGGVNAVEVGYMLNIPVAPALAVKTLFNTQNVNFRFNPTTADVSKTTWKYVNNAAMLTVSGASNAPGDATTLFATPTYTSNNDGSGKFTLTVGTWVEPAAGKTHLFALQANGKDFYSGANSQVVSDYVKVKTAQYNPFISNSKLPAYVHYRTAVPAIGDVEDHTLAIDPLGVANQVDLDNLVWATANKGGLLEKMFADYGFGTVGVDYKFDFSIAATYLGLDGLTNQNAFVTLDANNVLKIKEGTNPIDRRPLVTVKLTTMSGVLLAQAYIKFKILPAPAKPAVTYTYVVPKPADIKYETLFKDAVAGVSAGDVTPIVITWPMMNEIYNGVTLTHNEYQAKYQGVTPTVKVKVNGTAVAGATYAQYPLTRSVLAPDVDSYAIKYNITPFAKFGTTELEYTFNTGNAADDIVVLKFSYTILAPVLDKAIIPAYQYNNATTVFTQGIKTGASYAMELNLGEGFGFGSAALKAMFGVAANKIDPATQEFIVTDPYVKAGVASYVFSQAAPSQTSIDALLGTSNATGVKMGMNPANPLDIAERAYPVNFKTTYPNGEVDNFNYTVIFKNPLTISLEATADFNLLDIKTGAKDQIDLSKNYVVKMLGEVVFDKTGPIVAKAAEYGLGAATVTYTTPNIVPAFAYAYSFLSPIASWENAGTKLTNTQKVADAVFTYSASFASTSRTDAVNVNPDLSAPVKRK